MSARSGQGVSDLDLRFSTNLKAMRTARGWRQKDLAARMGLSDHRISELESCRDSPSLWMVDKVVRALNCDPRDLFEPVPEVVRLQRREQVRYRIRRSA